MAIQSVYLRNFQKHRKRKIDLDDRITTLIAPNDQGKTAILRAIRWAATNRGSGRSYARIGAKGSMVARLEIDGHRVGRTRGKAGNNYHLDERTYRAVGTEVPDPIARLFNVGETNFQWQFDPPFWYTESAGQVSKNLNSIINLGVIDRTLAEVTARERRAKAAVELTEERLTEARGRRKALAWVPLLDQRLTTIEGMFTKLVNLRNNADSLERLIGEAGELSRKAKRPRMVNLTASLDDLGDNLAEVERLRSTSEALDDLIAKGKGLEQLRCQKLKSVGRLEKELHKILRGRCPVCHRKIPQS